MNKTKQGKEAQFYWVIINIFNNIIVVVVIVTKDCSQMSAAVGKQVWSVALEAMIQWLEHESI